MISGNEQMQSEFHDRATPAFFAVYRGFENAASNVSRRKEEYRFQQLKKLYATTMEQELQIIARDILVKYRAESQIHEIDQMFHQFIKDYLHRFIQKINDL